MNHVFKANHKDFHAFTSHEAVAQACRSIELAEEKLDLAALAASAGLSPSHFQRVFKSQVGLSPKQYEMALRKQRFRDELKSSKTVTQTIYEAGYDSPSRAYADNATPGLMPSKYKRGAQGEKIRYAHRETSLGSILVAATDRRICLVEFVEKEEALSVLKAHFPSAELQEDATDWKEWISEWWPRLTILTEDNPTIWHFPSIYVERSFRKRYGRH